MLQRNDRRIRETDKQTGGALQSIDLIALLTKKPLGTINMKEKRLRSDSPRKRKVDAIEKIQSRQRIQRKGLVKDLRNTCSVIRLQMESSHISLNLNKSVVRMEMILKPLPKTQR